MKFRSEQGILAEALGALARVASNRNAGTPALSGVKLTLTGDTLVAVSTDNDIALQFTLAVGGDTDGQGLVSARMLNDIVRVMPSGKVTVEVAGETALISGGRSQFTIPTLNAIEFPRTSAPEGDPLEIASSEFKAALDQVVGAASTDQQRPNLTAVLVASTDQGLRLVATDGYRMAMRDIVGFSGTPGDSFLIPARALAELQRLLDMSDTVTVRFSDIDASFQSPSMTLTTRLVNTNFPPYENIIPKDKPNVAVVGRDELLAALRRTRVLSSDMAPVRVQMSTAGMTLSVQLTDGSASTEDLDCRYDGEDITVAFNPEYLAVGAEKCGSEEVTISTVSPARPAIIRPVGDETYLYLLMPQRV